jgi:hypothetical protein
LAVAQAQVLVADPLRAGEERIGELHGRHVEVALHLLEPFEAVARRRLQAKHLDPPLLLVALEGALHRGLAVQVVGQRDGAVDGEPGARSDGEMPVAAASPIEDDVLVVPLLADHAGNCIQTAEPRRCAAIGHEVVPAQVPLEDALAGGDDLLLLHALEAPGGPRSPDGIRR